MVKATVSLTPEKHELQSLEGGHVTLRRLTYGQKMERQELATQSVVDSAPAGNRKQRRQGRRDTDNLKVTMKAMHRTATQYDFKHCIVDHNLEDENGQKLNFQDPLAIDKLDPRAGDEIAGLIDDLNNFEEDELEEGN